MTTPTQDPDGQQDENTANTNADASDVKKDAEDAMAGSKDPSQWDW